MTLEVVGPQVFDLVGVLARANDVFQIPPRLPTLLFQPVRESSQLAMQALGVPVVQVGLVVEWQLLLLVGQSRDQLVAQRVQRQVAQFAGQDEGRVLQRGIVDRLEIPQATVQPAVKVIRSQLELGLDRDFVVGRQQWGQQHLKLLSEAVVGIEADRLQVRLQGIGGIQQLQIDSGKEAQILAHPAIEIVTGVQPDQVVLGA